MLQEIKFNEYNFIENFAAVSSLKQKLVLEQKFF